MSDRSTPQLTALYLYDGLELIPVLFFSKGIDPFPLFITLHHKPQRISPLYYTALWVGLA
jgi:hypothetical protein